MMYMRRETPTYAAIKAFHSSLLNGAMKENRLGDFVGFLYRILIPERESKNSIYVHFIKWNFLNQQSRKVNVFLSQKS